VCIRVIEIPLPPEWVEKAYRVASVVGYRTISPLVVGVTRRHRVANIPYLMYRPKGVFDENI
jgi:hypothetical protein